MKKILNSTLFLAILALFVCCFGTVNSAENIKIDKAELLTQKAVSLGHAYRKAGNAKQADILSSMVNVLKQRKLLFIELASSNPSAIERLTLPSHIRDQMPDIIKEELEIRQELRGSVDVFCFTNGNDNPMKYILKSGDRRYILYFSENSPELLTGDKIRVSGVVIGCGVDDFLGERVDGLMIASAVSGSLNVLDSKISYLQANNSGSQVEPPLKTIGEQRTAVIMFLYEDDPENPPYSVDEMRDYVFGTELGTVNRFFLETSYNQAWLAGDIFGWYRVSVPFGECKDVKSTADNLAEEMAVLDGFNREDYDLILHVNATRTCMGGFASQGGPDVWIDGVSPDTGLWELYFWIHEIGHGLGLKHANAWDCGDVTLGENCMVRIGTDKFDTMGAYPNTGHYNAFHKEMLGWLNYGQSPQIIEVKEDGEFFVDLYGMPTSGPKAIKISKGINPSTGQLGWYYLEYRQPILSDTYIGEFSYQWGRGDVTDSLIVHMGEPDDYFVNPSNPNASFMLHMNPTDSDFYQATNIPDWWDPGLHPGQTYNDLESGVSFTTLLTDGNQATIDVSFTTPSCQRLNPMLDVFPQESQWALPGTEVAFNISVTNRDPEDCGPSIFEVQVQIPFGWSQMVDNPYIQLNSGEIGTTTVYVTSPTTASEGFYDVTITTQNQSDPSFSGFENRTYVVDYNGTNDPPIALDDDATTKPELPVTIDILANDYDPENQPLSLISTTQGTTGSVTINTDNTVTYIPSQKMKKPDSFFYTISDGETDSTAKVTVKLEKDTGKGNGKN